jgi:hypothetical protein
MANLSEEHGQFLFGPNVLKQLRELGYIGKAVKRVVIDIPHDDYGRLYVQKAVESDVLDVLFRQPDTFTVKASRIPMRFRDGLVIGFCAGAVCLGLLVLTVVR